MHEKNPKRIVRPLASSLMTILEMEVILPKSTTQYQTDLDPTRLIRRHVCEANVFYFEKPTPEANTHHEMKLTPKKISIREEK